MDQNAWDERYRSTELVWGAEPNRFVVETAGDLPAGRAVDLAAGEGRNAVWLAQRGWQVTASEFSTVAIERGERLAAANGVHVDWVYADVREHTPDVGAYDLVLLAYLHLPVGEWTHALHGAVRAMAPGGRLVSIGHDRDNLEHGTGGPPDPAILHDAEEITSTVTDAATAAGYTVRVQRAGQVNREVTDEDGIRTAIDTLVVIDRVTDAA